MSVAGTDAARPGAAALFAELCDLPGGERASRLAALEAAEPALAAAVRALLALDAADDGPLERLQGEVAATAERRLAELGGVSAPASLGPWRLVERLGEGGMGEVWIGERTAGGFEQRAAVKLVRAGMASPAVVSRFLVERQLLARLEHPSIARLLDGGVAPDGRPWFAMELVAGSPITQFAAARALDLEARVKLAAAVADAVDFAHRALVVHRDLKPSNILVTPDGAPKLLDFGLAKLLDPAAGGDATRTELLALTPAYAAPEQVLGGAVTTAADVYSLGVVLYELVTGRRPHRREARTGPGLAEELAHETLTRPSQAALAGGASVALPQSFARRLRGDLDTVIAKALSPDLERRYVSAAELARDLRNWIAGRPVAARPDTAGYRLRRFARRNLVAVSAAALVALSLVAGLVATAWQARRATREARRALEVQGFLIGLFEGSDPDRSRGATITARELLAEGARQLDGRLEAEPEAKSALLDAVAQIERRIGLVEESERHARAAVSLLEKAGAPELAVARARITVGEALVERGDPAAARAELEPLLATLGAARDGSSADLGRAEIALAGALIGQGDRKGGLALAEREVARELEAHGEASLEVADARLAFGQFLELSDRFDEALANYRQSVATFDRELGAGHARTETARLSLAELTAYRGDLKAGEALFRQTIDGLVRSRGEKHLLVAHSRLKFAVTLINQGRYAEADRELETAFPILEAAGHFDAASCLRMLGSSYFSQGRYAEAAAKYGEARERFRKSLGEEHQLTLMAAANLGGAQVRLGELAAGQETLRAAIAGLARLTGEESDSLRQPLLSLGEAERKSGHPDTALATHRRLLAIAERLFGPEHAGVANARREIALDLAAEGGAERLAEARRELDRAIEIRVAVGGPNHPRLAEWLSDSAALARAAGDPARAAADERARRRDPRRGRGAAGMTISAGPGATDSPRRRTLVLFDELCDLEGEARARRLAEVAQSDPALARSAAELLARDGDAVGPLERLRGAVDAAASARFLDGSRPPFERLGAWRLSTPLGEGGMGEVWLATREEGGFEQRSAVKIVRRGMASGAVVARFELERQLLARLEHPAIARVYDGGVAPDGRPWFAMERVEGEPITRYLERHGAPLAAQLRLMGEVALAVDAAHRSFIVHRDLKPSNILVTAEGRPKLLDFGLAKLLEAEGDRGVTRTELRALTPAYAAPEQILGEPITTATDVYALGVLLYEILTGELPNPRSAKTPAGLAEEATRETVERPSLRLEKGGGGRERLPKRLSGDLDTIVLKALARDPARRYPTAAALADDLARLLDSRPILARPDSFGYRARRFVRRHRAAVAATALALLSLAGGLAMALYQARAARLEANRTVRVRDFLASIFESADPDLATGRDSSAAALVADGVRRIEEELADEPRIAAELYTAIGRTLLARELYDEAKRLAENCHRLASARGDIDPAVEGRAELLFGEVETARQELIPGEARLRRAAELLDTGDESDRLEQSRAFAALGHNLNLQERGVEAREWCERAHRELARRLGGGNRETVRVLIEISHAQLLTEGAAAAAERIDRALAELGGDATANPLTRALLEVERGQVAIFLRKTDEAEAAARAAMTHLAAAGAPGTASLARARQLLAMAYLQRGDFPAAEIQFDHAIELYRDRRGWSPVLASLRLDRILVLEHAGRVEEGIRLRRELLEETVAELGPKSAAARLQRSFLGSALVIGGRLDEAERELRRVIDDSTKIASAEQTRHNALFSLGELYLAQGRNEEALAVSRERLHTMEVNAAAIPGYELAEARLQLARIDLALGGPGELREARAQAEAAKQTSGDFSARHGTTPETVLARADLAEGNFQAARRGFEASLASLEANGRASSAEAGTVWLYLGQTLRAENDRAAARRAFERAHETLFRRLGADHRMTQEARRGIQELAGSG